MKISSIELSNFHQFEDLIIDLTYPKGHEKEGEPLEKICIIGQSGTGKTTLLELIPKFLASYNTPSLIKSGLDSITNKVRMRINFGNECEISSNISFKSNETDEGKLTRIWGDYNNAGQKIDFNSIIQLYNDWVNNVSTKIVYFSANLDYEIDMDYESQNIFNRKIIDFSKEKISAVWRLIIDEIGKYQEEEIKLRLELSSQLEQGLEDIDIVEKAFENLRKWKQTQFNPVKDIAENCLNKLLEHFNLRVKTTLDFKKKDDIGFIKIEDLNGNEIPYGLWSTGTKQVILSALPLYLLKPSNTVILFDEPERSLYPDIQRLIVNYYLSFSNHCQYFYATHSPIIASSFEPWEIVELKFDEKGKVYRELYYEGENIIDNYKLCPQFMRWDDILQRVFDLENDGSDLRKSKLDELARLNVLRRNMEKEGKLKSKEGEILQQKINQLSTQLSKWD